MIVNNEPYLIEYNVRMGIEVSDDITKIKNGFNDIILACCEGRLHEINIEWFDKRAYV